jgi:ATP-dependent RNA helicase RhlE
MKFEDLGLMPELLLAVADTGYTEPTPIQQQAIPVVLAGKDVMGGAQTGTGKTAGFTLPLLQRLSRHANTSPSPARHPVRALILCPTRELAMQVHESVVTYCKHLALRSVVIYGGVDMRAQMEQLRQGREIVVATPGRLLDHVEQKTVNFGQVEVLVLDEADRMLDMGFIPDIKRILALLPKERQSLLFSATFSEEIKRLADAMLRQPQLIEVARRNALAETVTHRVHPVAQEMKRQLLAHIIRSQDLRQALVFVATKFGASRLAVYLSKQGIEADAIHGDKSQQQRTEALEAFKSGKVRVLVGTDVAARGLDIEDLPHVINFDLPHTPEDYIHRIGRTGRAGKEGNAISLVSPDERGRLADIERLIKRPIEKVEISGFAADNASHEPPDRTRRGRGRERWETSPPPPGARAGREPRRTPPSSPASRQLSDKLPGPGDFDWRKPYEPSPDSFVEPALPITPRPSHKPRRQIAALLGGLAKKPN